MNNEYMKVGEDTFIVSNEKGKFLKRRVNFPKLFEYENNVEIINNEINSLKTKKKKIRNKQKKKNLRHLILYTPILTIGSILAIKETAAALLSSSNVISKVCGGIMCVVAICTDSVFITDTIFSNIKTCQIKKKIDNSLKKANILKKKYEKELNDFKIISMMKKDNTKENTRVSLKESISSKTFEVKKEISYYSNYDSEKYSKPKTLVKKR